MILIEANKLKGKIYAPPSKSESIRALLASLLTDEEFAIFNLSECEDARAALKLAANFKEIDYKQDHVVLKSKAIETNEFNCGESALIARMAPAILSLKLRQFIMNGEGTLKKRDLSESYNLFPLFGLECTNEVFPFEFQGKIHSNNVILDKIESSQAISGLLFALPFVSDNSTLEIRNVKSKTYIDLSISILKELGVIISQNGNRYFIQGSQKISKQQYNVGSDSSSLAFLIALSLFNKDLEILHNIRKYGIGADHEVLTELLNSGIDGGFEISIMNNPDLFPILVILAATAGGTSTIHGISRLSNKESNRLASMVSILDKIECRYLLNTDDDLIIIHGQNRLPNDSTIEIDSFNDHRIVMAGILAAYALNQKVVINGSEAIAKSYPNLFRDMQKVGAKIDEQYRT